MTKLDETGLKAARDACEGLLISHDLSDGDLAAVITAYLAATRTSNALRDLQRLGQECEGDRPEIIELQAFVEVSASVRDFRDRGNIQRKLAGRLGDEMVTREVIEFADIIADDEIDGTDIYRARVRAVAPDAKAWLVERQADVAKQVAKRAIALIRQWGSDYGDAHVSKDRAVSAINQALGEA